MHYSTLQITETIKQLMDAFKHLQVGLSYTETNNDKGTRSKNLIFSNKWAVQ